jgi:predicted nucleotide-binding protein
MKPHFLVAEDDPAWQHFFRLVLGQLGFDCTILSDWSGVYSNLFKPDDKRIQYTGIILDLGLGVEATISIEELNSISRLTNLPILVTTSAPDVLGQLARRCLAIDGVSHFTQKFKISDLLVEIVEFVGSKIDAGTLEDSIFHRKVNFPPSAMDITIREKTQRIFVVHGQNIKIRKGVFEFIRAIGLTPIEWGDALEYTNKPAPFIKEVLDKALKECGAVIVLLTPDDEVIIRKELRKTGSDNIDNKRRYQARPNVYIELGLAMASVPDRVILVEVGTTKIPSDIHGIHLVRLNDSPESRNELVKRLETCGCPVKTRGSDWLSAGKLTEHY